MVPEAKLVYKTTESSLNYIDNAREYVTHLGYYCSLTTDGSLHFRYLPNAVFILTSEVNSGYINKDQYQAWKDAESQDIPVYVIYKRKGTNELNIYTAKIISRYENGEKYAQIADFIKDKFETYYEGKPKKVLKKFKFNPYHPDSYKCSEDDELLLIV